MTSASTYEVSTFDEAVAPQMPSPLKVPIGTGPELASDFELQERFNLTQQNEELSKYNARLAEENKLLQSRLENQRLAEENRMLRLQIEQSYMQPCSMMQQPWTQGDFYPAAPNMMGHGQVPARRSSRKGFWAKLVGEGRSVRTEDKSRCSSFGEASTKASTSFTSSVGEVDDAQTTRMMRNIPNNYTRDVLLELFDECGFKGKYNLVYLPIDFKTEVNLGYAFIDLVSEEEAARFCQYFGGFSKWKVASDKVCEVSWSDALQGTAAHVDRYRNSPVMHDSVPDEFKPALFLDGERVQFPPPTKKIRPPRQWTRRH